jgi:hypothetical protein
MVFGGLCLIVAFSNHTFFSGTAPAGSNGHDGHTCGGCHASAPLNSGGGNVTISGFPTGTYVPGQSYPIEITITHGAADRTRWGFALGIRNGADVPTGTFTSNSANATLIAPAEIGHQGAVITPASSSYTYSRMNWIAPSNPTASDLNLTLYLVGNAANNNNAPSGDFVYTSLTNLSYTIPVVLTKFTGGMGKNFTTILKWETAQEQNSDYFAIERSTDGQNYTAIGRMVAAGNSTLPRNYEYIDQTPPVTTNGRVLYRLKQVDKDGKTNYSTAVAVQLKAPTTLLEAPVPNVITKGGTVTMRLIADETMPLQILVTDANGKKIYTARQQAVAGANIINLPSTAFSTSSGIYNVSVLSGGFSQTERIVVQ